MGKEASGEKPSGGISKIERSQPRRSGSDLGSVAATIGSLEKGRYNPSILLAFKIARYFGTSIEEIFIYEEE